MTGDLRPQVSVLLPQEDNGAGIGGQKLLFFFRDLAVLPDGTYIREHDGKGLFLPMFPDPEASGCFRAVRPETEVKAPDIPDRDDAAVFQHADGCL